MKKNKDWFCTCPGHITVDDHGAARGLTAVGAKNKFWPAGSVLKVGFSGGTTSQQSAVKTHAAKWSESANLTFSYPTVGPYDLRIAFSLGSAWSYVGLDCKLVSQSSPTMNLGWIAEDVILHEFGHSLGLLHEQQNPEAGICWDEPVVIAALSGAPNYWSLQQIRFNVLDKHPIANVITSPWDALSIMHYNIPASWTCNKVGIPGGKVLSPADKAFIALRYPGIIIPPVTTSVTLTAAQVTELKTTSLAAQNAVNAAKVATDAHRAKVTTILGQ